MINAMLETVGVESTWEGGMRVSTEEVVDVAVRQSDVVVSTEPQLVRVLLVDLMVLFHRTD